MVAPIVSGSPYHNPLLGFLDQTLCAGMLPFCVCIDRLLSSLQLSVAERRAIWLHRFIKCVITPVVSLLGVVVTAPFAFIALLAWATLQSYRRPYRYSYANVSPHEPARGRQQYCFATANVCLLPEYAARYNKLPNAAERAVTIGKRIVGSQRETTQTGNSYEDFRHAVIDQFPQTDLLLVQEAFHSDHTRALVTELHAAFPHIVHDVGVNSLASNLYCQGSGLLLASKHAIESVRFDWFINGHGQCRLASKGLLQVKLQVGMLNTGQKMVGFVFNTHLQSYQGSRNTICKQLDDILRWTSKFRYESLSSEDVVIFDVLGGDFNFDNMSPGEENCWSHRLFDVYTDVCRKGPGEDHNWTIGTEMRQLMLHDPEIGSPSDFAAVLGDPHRLQRYLLDANVAIATQELMTALPHTDVHGNTVVDRASGRRRVDYLLYRTVAEQLPVRVVAYNSVSQLNQLTDHVPVTLTIEGTMDTS